MMPASGPEYPQLTASRANSCSLLVRTHDHFVPCFSAPGAEVGADPREETSVLRYYVKVHCCGPEWLVHVPAVDRWTVTGDKRSIEATAQELIADVTGKSAESFTIDLFAGRAIGSPA